MNIDAEGRGAIALGNPDIAGHVATYVPGTSSGLPSLGGDMERAEFLLTAANRLNDGDNAVVTWVGYNAPPELPDAASAVYAEAGAPRLDSFQDGLRAAHEGAPSLNTVIGHSYGSTVIGHAMSDGNSLAVDNVVFAGSPGVGHGVNGVGELSLDNVDPTSNNERIFATAASSDPVTWIGDGVDGIRVAASVFGLPTGELGHGADPTNPSFVGSYSSSTYLDDANGIAYDAAHGYVYVAAEFSDAVTIVDVGNPMPTASPTATPSHSPTLSPTLSPTALPSSIRISAAA